jgi:hypothetical protein
VDGLGRSYAVDRPMKAAGIPDTAEVTSFAMVVSSCAHRNV